MILLYVIVACILYFIVIIIRSRRKACQLLESYEEEAVTASKEIYNTLSLPQRYAFLFILAAFKENVRGGIKDLAITIHQIELEERALEVDTKKAEAFFLTKDKERCIDHVMELLCEIKKQDKRITDFLIYRSYSIVENAGGYSRQYNMSNKEISNRLFFKIFDSIGYTKKELNDIVLYPDELINIFGRNK